MDTRLDKRSAWAAESFGQLCIAYLILHADASMWPSADDELAVLRRNIQAQANAYRHDRVFFDYLAGRAVLDNGDNGLAGCGLTLALRAFRAAHLTEPTEPPATFPAWQTLVDRIVGDTPTTLAAAA